MSQSMSQSVVLIHPLGLNVLLQCNIFMPVDHKIVWKLEGHRSAFKSGSIWITLPTIIIIADAFLGGVAENADKLL